MHDRVYSEVLTGHYYRRARPEALGPPFR